MLTALPPERSVDAVEPPSGSAASGWAGTFAAIARDLHSEPDVGSTLDRVVQLTVSTVDHCEDAGVSFVRHGHAGRGIDTPAATSARVRRAHELQDELHEGPCWDAVWEHETFVVDDLATEERWPRWSPRVTAEQGYRSVLSLRLFVGASTLGSLNLYAGRANAFDIDAQQVGLVLAAHAAVALSTVQEHGDLVQAASTRLVIGQAEGVLMERLGLTADQAFEVLRRLSNETNVKLRDVAQDVVASRGPGSAAPRSTSSRSGGSRGSGSRGSGSHGTAPVRSGGG